MLSSFIQNAQSMAGTLISALGKASAPSGVLSPRIWSPCMCEITTMSIALGSKPAAAKVEGSSPTVGPRPGAIAGVDQHEFGAGVDYDGIERRDDAALGHIGGLGGREDLRVTDIAHELGGERNGARAVIDDGDFELADLAAIEARRLPACERRGGLRGRGERRECADGGGRAGGGNDAATG